MILLSLVFVFSAVFGASAVRDYDSSPIVEVTKLSTLNNRLIKDKSLSIVNISTLSTPEQNEFKGDNDRIVFNLFKRIRQYENSKQKVNSREEVTYRELPLVPAVEASESGPVFVANNPFFTRNHTLNNVRDKYSGLVYMIPLEQHNLTTNGLRKLSELLSTLAKRYGEGLSQKVQLIALVLSRRVTSVLFSSANKYQLNVGVAVVAPEEDGYRPLSAVVLGLKTKTLKPPGPGQDYPADYVEYEDHVINYPFPDDQ